MNKQWYILYRDKHGRKGWTLFDPIWALEQTHKCYLQCTETIRQAKGWKIAILTEYI